MKKKCGFWSMGLWDGGMAARGTASGQVELNWLAILFSVLGEKTGEGCGGEFEYLKGVFIE